MFMRKKRAKTKRIIPEALANRNSCIWLYVLVLVFDAVLHAILFILYGPAFHGFLRLFFSFLFFIYPLYYLADTLWSLRPSVCGILSGEIAVNRKYYMNSVQKEVDREDLLPVTISVPVYLESNETIFETLRESLAAVKRYRDFSKKAANVVVSDDGLAPLLGGICTEEKVKALLCLAKDEAAELTGSEKKATERLRFYRTNHIGFVVRPAKGRAGLFKKGSNLNYTLRLERATAGEDASETLTKKGAPFEDGYWEGDITTHEVILLLDKDSGVKERIIEAILPEFAADKKLAYVQCATNAENLNENYYTGATGRQINNLFHNIWPCKALQGFFVPLVGHNVFLRKSLLEKSGLWAENRVSEDYDKALCFYSMGYHGKYAQIRGLEFTEYVGRTFTEETGKQRRYAYGLFEMFFDGTVFQKKARGCDIFYMLLYFCSVINQALLLPTVLLESYFGNIHLLWAGFLFCMACFILLPLIRSFVMRRRLSDEKRFGITHTLIIAVSFVGHSFSFLAGALRYLTNKIRENRSPFPATNVDRMDYRFREGVKLLVRYFRKTPLFLLIVFLCLDRGIYLLTRKGLEPVTVFTYCYILFGAALVPVFFTPPLVLGLFRKFLAAEDVEVNTLSKKNNMTKTTMQGTARQSTENGELSPLVVEKKATDGTECDVDGFLMDYRKALLDSLEGENIPEELLSEYTFESCLKKEPENKKELYLLRRKKDSLKALLRITKDYPEEDALEEAKLLQRLDHPGIPKELFFCEKNEKRYLVREYVEGRTLYDIITQTGCLTAEDIFGIARKLVKILSYLHAQTPPVIHRDIKPQNIVVGHDGSIHLIDFGIAREHKQKRRQDTSIVLTLDYASPEQYGFEQTTPLSDIYSLGVVFLFLATGRTVLTDLEAQIVNNRLRELIERCTAFSPKMRFPSADAIGEFLLREQNSQRAKRVQRIAAFSVFGATAFLIVLSFGTGFVIEQNNAKKRGYASGYEIGYTDGYNAAPILHRKNIESTTVFGNESGIAIGTNPANMASARGAFAAFGDGEVFYIADDGIWRMSANGTNAELLVQDPFAEALSYENGWLYYSSGDRILQYNIYTKVSDILCEGFPGILYVTKGNFHVLAQDGLYLLDLQGKTKTLTAEISGCKSLNIGENHLYFINDRDFMLYRCEIDGENPVKLTNENCQSFCMYDERVFCAVDQNGTKRLLMLEEMTGEGTALLETEAVLLHAAEGGIYFLDPSDSRIYRASFDGRLRERISGNRAGDFNLAGEWIFYHNDEDNGRLWCVRPDGSNDHPVR